MTSPTPSAPIGRRAAPSCSAWVRIDLAAFGDPRLPAIRPADRPLRPRPRLLRRRPLCLARHRGPQAAWGCRRSPIRCISKLTGAMLFVLILDGIAYLLAVNTVLERAQRAGVGSGRHLRRRRTTYDQRRLGAAGHDHLLGAGGERGRETADVGNAVAISRSQCKRARARRSAGRARLRQHRAREDQLPRRARRNGASFNLLQEQVRDAAFGLDEARENMRTARAELLERHEEIAHLAHHDALD